ncbi:hypothetical protein L1987_33148 [Smallanthus sonchifolius]|uniref:Uncharacterized protein n=1 Tax=Smallanthus sonchifolius TaxID=185202 RepID=A0ACB9HQA4_9ASTR|nr:hypothetical protein L1987_33148 [Smallanthus sonchifolius]
MNANGELKKSSSEDIEALLSLYEASYLGSSGEDVLSHAMEITTRHLRISLSQLNPKFHKNFFEGLKIPRHMRMGRLEARRYIEEYGNEDDHNPMVLEFAKFDYNKVQSILKGELDEVTRWWEHLGLTSSRIELAKAIAILLVIDDIYDTYIDMVEAYMVEVEWVKRGRIPTLEDYIENGVTTSGTCMALVHLFFLILNGVTLENAQHLLDPYPKLFTLAGILRLWDDLGTVKEEHERGDVVSSIYLLMKERNITCEEKGRKEILQLIYGLWNDLNAKLVTPNAMLFPMINVALNTSRDCQVVYQHDDDSYL